MAYCGRRSLLITKLCLMQLHTDLLERVLNIITIMLIGWLQRRQHHKCICIPKKFRPVNAKIGN